MAALLRFLAVLSVLLLLLDLGWAGRSGAGENHTSLHDYLERAQSTGIIDNEQVKELHQLALTMNLSLQSAASQQDAAHQHAVPEKLEPQDRRTSMFMRIYNHLTLLNVLYLSGAVIIMGAYTIFMTLAVEKCNYGGLSCIMLFQVAMFGGAGLSLWQSDQYAYAGGILCCVSTSMVPFTVYLIQRMLGVWPKKDPGVFAGFTHWIRPGWVVMEIVTVVVGVAFLVVVRFPFLVFPISFSLWYLSMDLSPLYPGWDKMTYDHRLTVRSRVSIVMGFLMALLGYITETTLGSEPDIGFWLYFFGTLTFWVAINFDYPSSDLYGSLFLLSNLGLILIGSHLDRTTFHVFGTLGIIEYLITLGTSIIKTFNSTLLWLFKALVAAALFSQAIRRDGNIEVLSGIVCVLAFNFNYLQYIASNDLYAIILLLTNLGFVSTAGLFSRPLDLWLFTLPDIQLPVCFVFSVTVLVYHAKIAKHFASRPAELEAYIYLAYRLLVSLAISLVFVFLRQPHYAWVGGVGVPLVTFCFRLTPRDDNQSKPLVISFLGYFFGVVFSIFLESNLLYLVCCVALLVTMLSMTGSRHTKVQGCVLAVLLVLMSIPLNSKFVITIGAIYLILYFAHLAYTTFKNSLTFPLVLILLGVAMIGAAIQYQRYEGVIQESYQALLPDTLRLLLSTNAGSFWQEGSRWDWTYYISSTQFTVENFAVFPIKWLFWPGPVTYALIQGPAPYVTYVCVASIVLLVAMVMWMELRAKLVEHLDKKVKVQMMTFSLSKAEEHKGHGLVVEIKGEKPSALTQPPYLALDVPGHDSFWFAVESAYGKFAASMARSVFLPYKLTPHLITLRNFKKGCTHFTATVLLGTGHKGSQRVKHATVTGALQKLLSHTSRMPCVVMYAQTWYHPWSRLYSKDVNLSKVLDGLDK